MAIDFNKDLRALEPGDLDQLSVIERRILARLVEAEPIRIALASDPTGVEMTYAGNGGLQSARIAGADVVIALLRGWSRV